jgi:hypothetical protein
MSEFNHHDPEGFICRNPEDFARKTGLLVLAGAEHVKIVPDHDRTLTRNSHDKENNGLPTSWDVMHEVLDEDGKMADDALAAHFAPLERKSSGAGGLTLPMAQAWWRASLGLHLRKTTVSQLKNTSEKMKYRPGVIDLLDTCDDGGIHVSIVSAGITDVIKFGIDAATREKAAKQEPDDTLEALLAAADEGEKEEEGKYPFIVANELLFDNGTVVGWTPQNLITSRDKLEKAHERLAIVHELRPYTVLVGDSPEDAGVVLDPGPEQEGIVLRVRMSDTEEGLSTTLTPDFIQESWEAGYDAIIRDSFEPLDRMARFIIKNTYRPRHAIPAQRRLLPRHTAGLRLPG